MRKLAYSGMFFLASIGAAQAQTAPAPTSSGALGDWRDEDGKAVIRIVDCNSHLWGVVASETIPGGIDKNNPDKTKRNRPTLGMPILLNMKKVEDEKDKWEGQVYDATSGKTYDSNIQVKSPTQLRVEGCVAMILCGGQTWTRVSETTTPPTSGLGGKAAAPMSSPVPASAQKMAPPPSPASKMAATTKGAVPKAGAGSTTGAIPATDPATAEICSLPEIAGAPH